MIVTEQFIWEMEVAEVLMEQHLPVKINADIINTYNCWKMVSMKQVAN